MNSTKVSNKTRFGQLARKYCQRELPLGVYKSAAGFYIGTYDDDGPISRESEEYFGTHKDAHDALVNDNWTQRLHP